MRPDGVELVPPEPEARLSDGASPPKPLIRPFQTKQKNYYKQFTGIFQRIPMATK